MAGSVCTRDFPSRYLSTPRDLIVYLPPGYEESDARYPVLYLQDGQNLFDAATAFAGNEWRADITADDLIRRGCIEPLILVGLYNTGVRRISEYTPTRDRRLRKGGKADRYAQMLAREVKPFIDHPVPHAQRGGRDGRGRIVAGRARVAGGGPRLSAGLRQAGAAVAFGVVG